MRNLLIAVVLSISIPTASFAGMEGPQSAALSIINKASSLIGSRQEKWPGAVDSLLAERFASEDFIESVLWKHWKSINQERRDKIIKFFPAGLSNNIVQKLSEIKSRGISPFRLTKVESEGVIRKARIEGKVKDVDIVIELFLREFDGSRWKIVDVVVNDASLRENYEGQFNYVINKFGVDELIRRLEKKANLLTQVGEY